MILIPMAIAYAIPCALAAVTWYRLAAVQRRMRVLDEAVGERRVTIVEIEPVAPQGTDFDADARFDLVVNGAKAGYAMTAAEVKTEVVEGLDIAMRRLSGFSPPTR